MNKIFVTGANGFIGKSLCNTLVFNNRFVCGAVRDVKTSSDQIKSPNMEYVSVGDINSKTNWKDILSGYDCVIHCAGRAHVLNKDKKDSLEPYRLINIEGTKRLAEQSAIAGIKRLVFLSSIGVNGNQTNDAKPFSIYDDPNPTEEYAISKYKAEKVLSEISSKTGLEIVILRIPLVYGHGAKGNFGRLLNLVRTGIPLPFGSIKNKRSFIGLDNLVDILICCVDHLNAAGKTFLVSDGEDLSTADIIHNITFEMQRSSRLFPFPISLLKFIGFILGRQKEIKQILGSLQIDINYTCDILKWKPPLSIKEGIKRMVQHK
jgi:nucleoside-diphosphate-sugar epimerase